MPEQTLADRVENLERRVDLLETLPGRVTAVELQILQLRGEMREQFSAVRQELREGVDALRTELRQEIREGDDETRRYMRVLHEEVLFRMATIQESLPRRRRR